MRRTTDRVKTTDRFAGVDGLRAVAALAVVLYHTWRYSAPSGAPFDLGAFTPAFAQMQVGVTLFFAISGFLLYRGFAASILRDRGPPDYLQYFCNRILRIFPAYLAILAVIGFALAAARLRISPTETFVGSLLGAWDVVLANALLIQNYHPQWVLTGIGPAWSLAIEVVFYAALPLAVAFTWRFLRRTPGASARRVMLLPPLAFAAIGLGGKALLLSALALGLVDGPRWQGNWFSVLALGFLCHAHLFSLGMVLAVLHVEVEDRRVTLPRQWSLAASAGAVLAFGIAAAIWSESGERRLAAWDGATALGCAALLALVVLPQAAGDEPRSLLVRTLETPLLRAVGIASFSLFLWHEPFIDWLRTNHLTFGGVLGLPLNLLLVLFVAGVASFATYRGIEAPALKGKSSLARLLRPLFSFARRAHASDGQSRRPT
jgi:peptidoglycan/LPS O-acetylase OafA/YrhL